MDGYDPYNFYGMGSASDPFNFFSSTGYSTQFAPTATSPFGDTMAGKPSPQASYYQNDAYAPPSGEAMAARRSPSQVPGTSGAPPETPSSTPGGVSSGAGTGYPGVPNAYPSLSLTSLFGGLAGGAGQAKPPSWMTLGQMGMRMMNAGNPQQQQQQNPQAQQIARMYGVDYQTALALMQMMQRNQPQQVQAMQYGGYPQAGQSVLVGEQGPELFTPNVPGTISPNPFTMQQNPMLRAMQLGGNIQRRRFGMPPYQQGLR